MAYTTADRAALDAAIVARGLGRQVLDVQKGDSRLRYAEMNLDEMLKLRDLMDREAAAASVQAGGARPARAFRGTISSGY